MNTGNADKNAKRGSLLQTTENNIIFSMNSSKLLEDYINMLSNYNKLQGNSQMEEVKKLKRNINILNGFVLDYKYLHAKLGGHEKSILEFIEANNEAKQAAIIAHENLSRQSIFNYLKDLNEKILKLFEKYKLNELENSFQAQEVKQFKGISEE